MRVYPDLPGARRLASARPPRTLPRGGAAPRGPLGLGTEFESLREYSPDDDVRQVNWLATARLGRPMSNQFRVERDRDVICLLDCGRLTAAPFGDATRLDLALDAAVAVAAVADVLGDRCGASRSTASCAAPLPAAARRRAHVVQALFDLEPVSVESDYERAFHELTRAKRAFALVLTDLIEPTAAQPLVDALPVLARHHAVAVASVADPDLDEPRARPSRRPPATSTGPQSRSTFSPRGEVAVARLRRAGADVVEARPEHLAAACVRAYLRAKARARL